MRISLQETADKLRQANKFVITAHVNPDGDAIGSCLGLYRLLKSMGKEVQVLIDDDIPKAFSFLPDVEDIKKPEEASYAADFLVMLDVSPDRVGRVVEKCKAPILNIDHHVTNDGKVDFLYLDADRAATAEIVCQLTEVLGVEPDKDTALCIYTGMATDTGFFRFSNTSALTMTSAGRMIAAGAQPHVVSEALEKRSFKEVLDRAKAMETIEQAFEGRVAGIYIDYALYETLDNTEGFIDSVRIIDGVDVAVFVKEVEPGKCRVSLRSKGFDVTTIATAFQGGGHVRAAGCTIMAPLSEAKAQLLAVIGEKLAQ